MLNLSVIIFKFLENFQRTIVDSISSIITVSVNYIVTADKSQPSGFSSKHGQSEVYGDIYLLCGVNVTGNPSSWWNYLLCVEENLQLIPSIAITCAKQMFNQKIVASLQTCATNSIGKQLLWNSMETTDSVFYVNDIIPASPTVFVNGVCVYGLPPCNAILGEALKRYICAQYNGTLPSGCSSS